MTANPSSPQAAASAAARASRRPGRLPGVRREAAPASKGEQTRCAIVDMALAQAARDGIEGLSIGVLADALGMSKSGVFAHFGSREALQLAVIGEYHARFSRDVFAPALSAPRGLPRLQALFDNWMRLTAQELDNGCLYISGAAEFDDRPGPVRDALYDMVSDWLAAMKRALALAQDEGHLQADADIEQMLFEIHALILALHHEARFMRSPGSMDRARTGFQRVLRYNGAKMGGNLPIPVSMAASAPESPALPASPGWADEPVAPPAATPAATPATSTKPARSKRKPSLV